MKIFKTKNRILLLSGILSSILFISTFIFAGNNSSLLFEDFDFPTGKTVKEFLTVSFDDLFKIFGNYSTLTDAEKKDAWQEYKGRYVRWKGVVNYKGISKDDWDRVGIRHNVYTNVELMFHEDKRNLVGMIKKGDSITYTGKLSLLFDRNLLFRLEDANIETVNDLTVEELRSKRAEETASPSNPTTISEAPAEPGLKKDSEGENSLSFHDLNKIFGMNSSISQSRKDELWLTYRGKYITWEGIVNYKGLSGDDRNRIGIRHNVGTNVELRLDKGMEDVVKMIKREDKITYKGRLADLFGRNLLCSIENAELLKIGDKTIAEIEAVTSTTSDAESPVDEAEKDEVISEPMITMAESMAPRVVKEEDIEITESIDGFITLSLEEIDEIFGKESKITESQKDKLWKEYKDKYVRCTGEVIYCGKGKVSGLRMGIKHKTGSDVELIFNKEKEDLVLKAGKGDTVTYTGKLVTRRGYILPYKLEDGNIESLVKNDQQTSEVEY